MADGRIIIDTQVDSSGAQKGVDDLNSVASKGLKGIGVAIAGIGTAIGAVGGFALKTGVDFESAFTGVRKTVDGTEEQFAQLETAIRNMAKSMPESASEIAGVAEAAGQLGIKTENIEGFTRSMVMLGDSTNMSSEEAATALARLANITQMPQTQFDKLGSVIVALGNNLATTESEISTMALRLAGAGHQVGMTEAQILSFAGALSSVGIEAEAGGSAFSKVMIDIQLATEKGGEKLDQFAKVAGMSASQFKTAFKQDAAGAMISFITGLQKTEEKGTSAIKVLDDMGITEVRMRDALLRAAGAGDVFTNALELGTEAWNENIALTKEAETRYDTTESKMKMIKNSIVDLGIAMFDKFREPFRESLDTVMNSLSNLSNSLENGSLGESVERLGKSFGDFISRVAEDAEKWLPKIIDALGWIMDNASFIASGIAGIGAALLTFNVVSTISNLIGFLNGTAKAIGLVAKAQTALSAVMAMSPIGWIIIGISAVVAALIMLWNTNDDFRNAIIGAWEKIKEVGTGVWNGIVDTFNTVIDFIKNNWKDILLFIVNPFVGGFKLLYKNCDGFREFVDGFIQGVKDLFINGWNSIVSFFTETIPGWIDDLKEWFDQIPYNLGVMVGEAIGKFFEWKQGCSDWINNELPQIIEDIAVWFALLPSRIKAFFDQQISDLIAWGEELYNTASTKASETIDSIGQFFSELPGKIKQKFDDTIEAVKQWGSDMYNKASSAASDTVDSIIDFFRDLPNKMLDIGRNIVGGIWEGMTSKVNWLGDKISSFCGGIVDGFTSSRNLDIHSPSRIMRDLVGTNIVKGIGVGIDIEMPNLDKQIDDNINNLSNMLKGTVNMETAKTTASVVAQNNITIGNTNNATKEYNPNFNILAKVSNNIDSEPIAEVLVPMTIESVSEEQNSYRIARGGN